MKYPLAEWTEFTQIYNTEHDISAASPMMWNLLSGYLHDTV